MRAPKYKWIPAAVGEKYKEYNGYKIKDEKGIHFASLTYVGDGEGYLWGSPTQHVSNISELQEKISYQEQEQWYIDHFDITDHINSNNLIGLFHDMYDVGDAFHEMWNGWVGTDFYEMAADLYDEDFYLLGIAPAPWDKDEIFGKGNSVAFVACYYSSDERFWCHGSKKWVEYMRKQMKNVYEELKI